MLIQHAAFLGFSGILIILPLALIAAMFAFEIVMIISAWQNPYISSNTRLLWVIGMLFVHPLVAIAYYFTDYKKTQ